jgi:hypothetical protein
VRAVLCAFAVVVIAVWEIAVLARARTSAASDEDWQAAAAWVRERHRGGDLIVFAPGWVDPVGRRWLGDLLPIPVAARMDDARYPRVFEVSIRDAVAPEARGTVVAERDGPVRVRLLERPAPRVTWDLGERAVLREVDFTPRRCVPLRPDGTLDFPGVPLGSELVVYAGIADFRSRRANRAVASVRVLVDDVEVSRAEIGNGSGWHRLPVATTTPGVHHVVFAATSPGKKDALDLCLFAEARTP